MKITAGTDRAGVARCMVILNEDLQDLGRGPNCHTMTVWTVEVRLDRDGEPTPFRADWGDGPLVGTARVWVEWDHDGTRWIEYERD